MGEARYAFRVRGRSSDAVLTALQEGLDVDVAPTSTAVRGWLPDQAALSGMLARIRLLGLELLEVRRLPRAYSTSPQGTVPELVPSSPGTPDPSSQRSAWTAASPVMVMAKPPRPDRCPD